MKKVLTTLIISSIVLLLMSFLMMKLSFYLFPEVTMEYLSPVFRTAGKMDWMFYAHPFVISVALLWFWERYKSILKGNFILRALELSLVYCIVAMIPVLWLTFSAIDVSGLMVATWILYGFIQAFAAGLVFAKFHP